MHKFQEYVKVPKLNFVYYQHFNLKQDINNNYRNRPVFELNKKMQFILPPENT